MEAGFHGRATTDNDDVAGERTGSPPRSDCPADRRFPPSASCQHSTPNLLHQRLHALCPGHEALKDHDGLRHDVALQTVPDRDTPLTSALMPCRLESQAWLLDGVDP